MTTAELEAEVQHGTGAQLDEPRGEVNTRDYVQPYKYRACEHGVWIPEWPRLYIAARCPLCFPEGASNCDAGEYGDCVAFGFLPQILGAVKKYGYIFSRQAGAEAEVPFGVLDAVTQTTGEFVRHDACEDLVNACRLHLIRKRGVITKRAEILGWTTPAMKAYVRQICENYIKDIQQKKSEHHVERGKDSFANEYREDGDGAEVVANVLDGACDQTGKMVGVTTGLILCWREPDMRPLELKRLLEKLPAGNRAAFEARYPFCNGHPGAPANTWTVAAKIAGASESSTRHRADRAIELMKEMLEPEEGCA